MRSSFGVRGASSVVFGALLVDDPEEALFVAARSDFGGVLGLVVFVAANDGDATRDTKVNVSAMASGRVEGLRRRSGNTGFIVEESARHVVVP